MLKPLEIEFSRDLVIEIGISEIRKKFNHLISSPRVIKFYKNRLRLSFSYQAGAMKFFEDPDFRNFIFKLDNEFPFWLYFVHKDGDSLANLVLCFVLPYLTEPAKKKHFPEKVEELLSKRWIPALKNIKNGIGMDDDEYQEIEKQSIQYFETFLMNELGQ